MRNHTPGPWLAIDTRDNDIDGWKGAFGVLAEKQPIGAMYNDICTVWHRSSKRRTNANAALIASAPELLAALERLLDCYSTSNIHDTRQSCWNQAKAAITKATGGTP